NPGTYSLNIHLVSFGKYVYFQDSYINIEFNILKCYESYLNQDKYNINLKACPACVVGKCVNDDTCDCQNTKFKENFVMNGFSLIYGSLLVKTYHVEKKINSNEEEFMNCKLPDTEIISNILNLTIVLVNSILTYDVRNVKKNFKENMAMPVYVYLVVNCLILITNQEKEMSLLVKDFILIIGSMISSFALLYWLYIDKFITLFFRIKTEKIRSERSLRRRSSSLNTSDQNLRRSSSANQSLKSLNRRSMFMSQAPAALNQTPIKITE
ncbi:hypothetical protein PIROE2DRAFT_12458, partial [Piromyces sp. E2]